MAQEVRHRLRPGDALEAQVHQAYKRGAAYLRKGFQVEGGLNEDRKP